MGDLSQKILGLELSPQQLEQLAIGLDEILVAQRQELDAAKRKEMLRQAARRIVDQAWSVGFYYGQSYTFVQPYVRSFAENALFGLPPVYETWPEK